MTNKVVTQAAIRQRRHRALEREGKIRLLITVDEVRLAAMLSDEIAEGAFLATDSPSKEQLADAVSRFLETFVTRYERDKFGPL